MNLNTRSCNFYEFFSKLSIDISVNIVKTFFTEKANSLKLVRKKLIFQYSPVMLLNLQIIMHIIKFKFSR